MDISNKTTEKGELLSSVDWYLVAIGNNYLTREVIWTIVITLLLSSLPSINILIFTDTKLSMNVQ
jgi:hypothetical protein